VFLCCRRLNFRPFPCLCVALIFPTGISFFVSPPQGDQVCRLPPHFPLDLKRRRPSPSLTPFSFFGLLFAAAFFIKPLFRRFFFISFSLVVPRRVLPVFFRRFPSRIVFCKPSPGFRSVHVKAWAELVFSCSPWRERVPIFVFFWTKMLRLRRSAGIEGL